MPAPWQVGSPYHRAWWGVFLTTVAAGPTSVFVTLFIFRAKGSGSGIPLGSLILGGSHLSMYTTVAMIPVGAAGAAVCAAILKHRPLSRTMPLMFLLVLIASVVSLALVFLVGLRTLLVVPVLIMSAQLLASLISLRVKRDPALVALDAPTGVCHACHYSLEGLDRAKTSVCPECGEALPTIAAR